MVERSDSTKLWTEKMLRNTEAVLTPNPGYRVEDFLLEKIEKKRPNRLTNLEYLGLDMMEAGNVFGSSTPYGSTLIKVGQTEQKLGVTEREYIGAINQSYIMPLRKFLEGEMKTIMKERSILEGKRIDLDSCKNKLRKARSIQGQQAVKWYQNHWFLTTNCMRTETEHTILQAERELRVAQSEFDRQAEITRLLLEGISSSHASHLRCLHEMVQAQARYHAQCHATMQALASEIARYLVVTLVNTLASFSHIVSGEHASLRAGLDVSLVLQQVPATRCAHVASEQRRGGARLSLHQSPSSQQPVCFLLILRSSVVAAR
ncbi:UNVERIFIED_CONTAM: hypothetical protein B566_EDAN019268 [Ephemera danica]|nr:hypothetical protein B566_EDAN019268 [Ephemera danica]